MNEAQYQCLNEINENLRRKQQNIDSLKSELNKNDYETRYLSEINYGSYHNSLMIDVRCLHNDDKEQITDTIKSIMQSRIATLQKELDEITLLAIAIEIDALKD